MLVQGVKELQFTDECKCRYILIAVGNLGQLALKLADERLEIVTLLILTERR